MDGKQEVWLLIIQRTLVLCTSHQHCNSWLLSGSPSMMKPKLSKLCEYKIFKKSGEVSKKKLPHLKLSILITVGLLKNYF